MTDLEKLKGVRAILNTTTFCAEMPTCDFAKPCDSCEDSYKLKKIKDFLKGVK